MKLKVDEFIRRFLLHVLPDGFHRIRNYGLFANGHRTEKLALCRKLLDVPSSPTDRGSDEDNDPDAPDEPDDERPTCPCCGGRMQIIESFRGPVTRSGSTVRCVIYLQSVRAEIPQMDTLTSFFIPFAPA